MNQLLGYVNKIISVGPGGGSVFVLNQRAAQPVKVVANYDVQRAPPAVGICLEVLGEFVESAFGTQFVASSIVPTQPWAGEIVPLLSMYPTFQMFDWRRCHKLWKKLGSDFYHALDNHEFHKFTELLPVSQVLKLFDAWDDYAHLTLLAKFLRRHGAPMSIIQPLLKIYGSETLAKISDSPYRLSMVMEWDEADKLCQKILSLNGGENARDIAAVQAALTHFRGRGLSSVPDRQVIARLSKMLGDRPMAIAALKLATAAKVCVPSWHSPHDIQGASIAKIETSLLTVLDSTFTPSSLPGNVHSFKALVPGVIRTDYCTATSVKEVIAMASGRKKSLLRATAHVSAALEGYRDDSVIHVSTREVNLYETSSRSAAVKRCTYKDVIAGHNRESTSHYMLAFVHNADRLDVLMLNKLLRAIPDDWSWCLLADPDNLPTTGLGNCVELINASKLPLILPHPDFLRHRSPSAVDLGQLKDWLDSKGTSALPAAGFNFLTPQSVEEAQEECLGYYREAIVDGTAIILTATLRASTAFNQTLQSEHLDIRRFDKSDCTEMRLRPGVNGCIGSRVYVRKPNLQRCVLAAEHGTITRINAQSVPMHTPSGEVIMNVGELELEAAGPYSLSREDLEHVELGFAAPIRYRPYRMVDDVIVYIEPSRIMTPQALWAACTLAKRSCHLVGDLKSVNWLAAEQVDTGYINAENGDDDE